MLAAYCLGVAVAYLAALGAVVALVGAVVVLVRIVRNGDYGQLFKVVLLLVLGAVLLAAAAQATASWVWPPLEPRTIAVLVDQTYSMVDSDYGMAANSIECARQIVEQKVLPARLWWDKEHVYAVTPNATTTFYPLKVDRSSGKPRLPSSPMPSPDERGSDYLKAVENSGGILAGDGRDRHLFLVGDLIHQSPREPDPQRDPPPRPAARERRRFRGVTVYLLYPDSRRRPYNGRILPFWSRYLVDRGQDGLLATQSFAVALARRPFLRSHPVIPGAVTLSLLVVATAALAYCTRSRWVPGKGP